jgi:hypothetical protein
MFGTRVALPTENREIDAGTHEGSLWLVPEWISGEQRRRAAKSLAGGPGPGFEVWRGMGPSRSRGHKRFTVAPRRPSTGR